MVATSPSAVIPGPADCTEAIRLQLRSWPEVEDYLTRCKGVIVPLGSTEQHGPTGAIGTDALTAEAVALARELYGDREGHHATPSEIAITLQLEPSLQSKQRPLPEPAPAGPIHGPDDFRRRHPDGRMGSDPYLASAADGARFLDVAAAALSADLQRFLEEPAG
ncbi:MAG: creatininase family protein [Vulcanococcus sp.]